MKLCLVCNNHFQDDGERCPKDNAQLVPLGQDQLIGLIIQDRYRLESVIGKGSMGVVYQASQELIGRQVAIKVLHSHLVTDNEALKRFHQQAKAASRLNHPHIITLYDYGVIQGNQPYLVMDLLKGQTLAQYLEEKGSLALIEIKTIFKQICSALSEAHKRGVIHRDIKPDNIVLEENPNQKQWVKVVDFGIAKLVQGSEATLTKITQTGTVCGSPTYMSPEQFEGGNVDQRSDIYSLGIVLFEALTGQVPFTAADLVSLMARHIAEEPPSLKALSTDKEYPLSLEKMVQKALSKNPALRQQNMDEFWHELDLASQNETQVDISPQRIADTEDTGASSQSLLPIQNNLALPSGLSSNLENKTEETVSSKFVPPAHLPPKIDRLAKSRTSIPGWLRLVGFAQLTLPYLLALVLFGTLMVFLFTDPKVQDAFSPQIKPVVLELNKLTQTKQDPLQLLKQGKITITKSLLDKKAQAGKLTKTERQILNDLYLQLARNEAKQRHFKKAAELLGHVIDNNQQVTLAKSLLKTYRKTTNR